MPNYPSKNWAIENSKWDCKSLLKMIYVGYSLTEEGSYLKELKEVLSKWDKEILLNLYCLKQNQFIKELSGKYGNLEIVRHEAVSYNELPALLSNHHIGLILYKAKTDNYIHNAPNKLFEYLSCGLDVWFPEEMKGIYEYESQSQPKGQKIDFDNFSVGQIDQLLQSKQDERESVRSYFAEEIYANLLQSILGLST